MTSNLTKRIRQHNGIIKGGARATLNHRPWSIFCYVEGFNTKHDALSFEYRWKHGARGLYQRIEFLEKLLDDEKYRDINLIPIFV